MHPAQVINLFLIIKGLNMDEVKLGKYRHFKGNLYEVLGIATHSETLEDYVVYRALYGEMGLWIRPKEMFFEKISRDGKMIDRFHYIGDKDLGK